MNDLAAQGAGYDEAVATEFHRKRNEMRQKLYIVLSVWFDGSLRIDPDSEMLMQLTDVALGLECTPAVGG